MNLNRIKEIEKNLDIINKSLDNNMLSDSMKEIVSRQKAELEKELIKLKKDDEKVKDAEARETAIADMNNSSGKKNSKKGSTQPLTAWTTFVKDNMKSYAEKYGSHKIAMSKMAEDYHKQKGTTPTKTEKVETKTTVVEKKKIPTVSEKKNVEIPEVVAEKPSRTRVGLHHRLQKNNDEHYTLINTEKNIADLDFEKRDDGKWHMTCLTLQEKSFDKLDDAIDYAEKSLYGHIYKSNIDRHKILIKKRINK